MKTLLLLAVLTLSVRADNFEGTITQGAFLGFYTYTSDTTDGTYWAAAGMNQGLLPANSNDTLQGMVQLDWAPYPDAGMNGFEPDAANLLTSTQNDGYLTVTNGVVTDFDWTWAMGNFYATYQLGSWNTQIDDESSGTDMSYSDSGDLSFGEPIDLENQNNSLTIIGHPVGVPDGSSTLLLLGVGILSCLMLKRGITKLTRNVSVQSAPRDVKLLKSSDVMAGSTLH
jgi:hypothetical protein